MLTCFDNFCCRHPLIDYVTVIVILVANGCHDDSVHLTILLYSLMSHSCMQERGEEATSWENIHVATCVCACACVCAMYDLMMILLACFVDIIHRATFDHQHKKCATFNHQQKMGTTFEQPTFT